MIRAASAAGERQQRRHDIHVQRFGDDRRLQVPGPVGECRDTNAAFVKAALAAAQRRVRRGSLRALLNPALLLAPLFVAFRSLGEQTAGRATIVAGKDDERVVAQMLLFQLGHDAADFMIQRGDHAVIGLLVLVRDRRIESRVLRHLVRGMRGNRREIKKNGVLPS